MKFKLTKESKEVFGNKVYRIEALKDFTCINGREVKKGDKGGWIKSEENLSQDGLCWLFDEAIGMDNSRRAENSIGSGDSQQYGNSRQYGDMKMETGYCFAYKEKDWDITEVDMGDGGISLVKDYILVEDDPEELTIEEVCEELGRTIKIKK